MRYAQESHQGLEIQRCPIWVPKEVNGLKRALHLLSFALSSSVPVMLDARLKPDWYLLVVPTIACAPIVLIAAKLAGARTWVHVQDLEAEAASALNLVGPFRWLQKGLLRLEHAMLRAFDRVTTVSEAMAEGLRRAGIAGERIGIMRNWVDVEVIHPLPESQRESLRRNYDAPDDRVLVMYAGNLGRKQGFETLIEAVEILKKRDDIYFMIFGDGVERSTVAAAASRLPNLQQRPSVPPDELNELLNLADIHLVPQRDGVDSALLPSKVGGILASGRPLIATAHVGSELARVAGAGGVIVRPGAVDELVRAIIELADDPQRRRSLGERGRSYAVDHLSRQEVLNCALQGI